MNGQTQCMGTRGSFGVQCVPHVNTPKILQCPEDATRESNATTEMQSTDSTGRCDCSGEGEKLAEDQETFEKNKEASKTE